MCKKQRNNNIISLSEIWDDRGNLLPLEFSDLPFKPQRLFYISNVPNGSVRGSHAHKICQQFFICLNGKIWVHLYDGKNNTEIELGPNHAVIIPPMIWCGQEFYENALALVLASEKYDEGDYIRDFNKFEELV